MKIVMFTNTYVPHVGGVAGSVKQLTEDCRTMGNQVLVVAPEFPDRPRKEEGVFRVPAIQNFNGSDFSVSLPAPIQLRERLRDFAPDVIHTHHPYLLGNTALRVSAALNIPLIFTYHTMYEKYTHYVPADSPLLKRFVIQISTRFANLCDHIIAPSESVQQVLETRKVKSSITVIPTGVRYERFADGDGGEIRESVRIPSGSFVVGHVGRLAPEKNLNFLSRAVSEFLANHPGAHMLVVGEGPARKRMELIFQSGEVRDRVHFLGVCEGQTLINAYHAMDAFIFTSKSETQGMVLAEAMAAGVPVVALDAPGARDIVKHEENGFLLKNEQTGDFKLALNRLKSLSGQEKDRMQKAIAETAREFSAQNSARKTLQIYEAMKDRDHISGTYDGEAGWDQLLRSMRREWEIWESRFSAGVDSISGTKEDSGK